MLCHHPSAIVAQLACAIESGIIAFPDETAVPAQQRRLIDERGFERFGQSRWYGDQPFADRFEFRRQSQRIGAFAEEPRGAAGGADRIAYHCQVPRAAASESEARQSASEIRRRAKR